MESIDKDIKRIGDKTPDAVEVYRLNKWMTYEAYVKYCELRLVPLMPKECYEAETKEEEKP
jgi:hypothetical protein